MRTDNGNLLVKIIDSEIINQNVSNGSIQMISVTNEVHEIFTISTQLFKFRGYITSSTWGTGQYNRLEIYDGTEWKRIHTISSQRNYNPLIEVYGYGLRLTYITDNTAYYSILRSIT